MIVNDPIQFWEPLLKVIRSVEASPNNKKRGTTQYDSVVGTKPLAQLDTVSIQEAVALSSKERPGAGFIGAYQFRKSNLIGGENWTIKAGLQVTDLFNKKNQDLLAIYLITKVRKGTTWLAGTTSTNDFALSLSQEWAGLPVPYDTKRGNVELKAGQSYYDGVGTNSANTNVSTVINALNSIALGTPIQTNITPTGSKSNGIPPVPPIVKTQTQQGIISPFGSVSRDDFENIVSEEQYIRLNTK